MAKKILIVEDEANIVTMLESRLKSNGYDVIPAYDGEAGLDKARSEKPDLVILDIMLPKLDGYQVCHALKSDGKYEHIPIVMLTARGEVDDMKMGLEKGADAYVSKPFDAQTLIGVIKGLLGE